MHMMLTKKGSYYPAGIRRCTNVENTLIMVDDVDQPKYNVVRR